MRLLVRADGDAEIGGGHVMRCLALARRWPGPVAWSGRLAPALEERVVAAGIDLAPLSDPDAVVVDGYGIDQAFDEAAMASGSVVLRMDDHGASGLGRGRAAVLDANLGADAKYYPGRLVLAGSRYALLSGIPDRPRAADPAGGRVLATLGSSAPPHLVQAVIEALDGLEATLVLGALQRSASGLAEQALASGIDVLHAPASLWNAMEEHDVVLCAGGTTLLEVAAMGRPALVLAFAENQRPVRDMAVRLRIAKPLPEAPTGDAIRSALRDLLSDADARRTMAARGQACIDGLGSRRVHAWLASRCLRVRRATDVDRDDVLAWSNDPATRRNAFSPDPIGPEEHTAWWSARMADDACELFIIEWDGPVAFVRFELGTAALVTVNVVPERRGQGLGAAAIRAACDALHCEHRPTGIRALVRDGNTPSVKAFMAADFDEVVPTDADRHRAAGHAIRVFVDSTPRPTPAWLSWAPCVQGAT